MKHTANFYSVGAIHGLRHVVDELQACPYLRCAAKSFGQPNGHFWRNAAPLVHDFRHGRETLSAFAASVTLSPVASRHSCRTARPGCGGFFIGMVSLLVDEVHVHDVRTLKALARTMTAQKLCKSPFNGSSRKPGRPMLSGVLAQSRTPRMFSIPSRRSARTVPELRVQKAALIRDAGSSLSSHDVMCSLTHVNLVRAV